MVTWPKKLEKQSNGDTVAQSHFIACFVVIKSYIKPQPANANLVMTDMTETDGHHNGIIKA